jgi:hypothetical protein
MRRTLGRVAPGLPGGIVDGLLHRGQGVRTQAGTDRGEPAVREPADQA